MFYSVQMVSNCYLVKKRGVKARVNRAITAAGEGSYVRLLLPTERYTSVIKVRRCIVVPLSRVFLCYRYITFESSIAYTQYLGLFMDVM